MKEYVPPAGSIPTLPMPELSGLRTVHLVGIGGAGMSGLARLFLARGVRVSGSDLKESTGLAQLRSLGARISVGHRPEAVGEADVVVVSTAIDPRNPEVEEATRRAIPVLARAQVLAAMMRERRGIAVAGTHGKTTTTSMLAVILERGGLDPTYVVGGDLNESGSNARSGRGGLFLAEADESDGSFLLLTPEVAVVTNVDDDHLDFYEDRGQIEAAFTAFCRRAKLVVACADDQGAALVARASETPAIWYGEAENADVRVEGVVLARGSGRCHLRVAPGDGVEPWAGDMELPVPGHQHLLNAAGAVAAATRVGVSPGDAVEALRSFGGVRRRWELRGSARGASIVDDYAHHPTEIAATIAAARSDGAERVVAVFQPHRYSRTSALWRGLGSSLAAADVVVVTDVYGAGERPVPGVSGKLVVDALVETAPGKRAVYLPRRSDVAPFLSRELRPGDLVLTLGAGDITMVGEETLSLMGAAGVG
jgi:UDP-N-acetylmuramate--alanine ligase